MIDNIYKGVIQEVELENLVSIRIARKPGRVEAHPFDSSLPYMNIQTLELGEQNQYAEYSGYVIGKNDLVIVKDGHRSGKVFRGQEGIAASTMAILSPKNEHIHIDYIYCYLIYCYEDFQSRLRGELIAHLDMNYLRQMRIPLPDVEKQRAIAVKYQHLETSANHMRDLASQLVDLSTKLANNELKKKGEALTLKVDMMLKAWLHQIFEKAV